MPIRVKKSTADGCADVYIKIIVYSLGPAIFCKGIADGNILEIIGGIITTVIIITILKKK